VIQNATAADENADLRRQLSYVSSSRFPQNFTYVATAVIGRPPSEFQQQIGIAAGSSNGIRKNDPVVTADGLVGLVTQVAHSTAEVTLLTDPNLRVSALDMNSKATGMLSHGQGRGTLTLGRVPKSQVLSAGDTIVTQGWRIGDLTSLYPRGILIGYVSGASQSEVDLFWQAQVSPRVHFDSLRSVLVLIPKTRTGR
jgi:rod shape-determining protein MreC